MTRLALLAMVVLVAGACNTAGDDAATQDTASSVIAPAPDTLSDTTDTTRRDTDTTAAR